MYATEDVTCAVPPALAVTLDHDALQACEYRNSTTWRPNVPPDALSWSTTLLTVVASAAQPMVCGFLPLHPEPWQPTANAAWAPGAARDARASTPTAAARRRQEAVMGGTPRFGWQRNSVGPS